MSNKVLFVTSSEWGENSFVDAAPLSFLELKPQSLLERIKDGSARMRSPFVFVRGNDAEYASEEDFVFLNGSFQFYDWYIRAEKEIQLINEWFPEFYEHNYYTSNHLHDHFLNGTVVYTTVYKLLNNRLIHGFVRPVTGMKTFTGFVYNPNPDGNSFILDDLPPHTMITVSRAVDVQYERRNIIIDGKVVTHSPYSYSDETAVIPDDINQQMDEFLAYFVPEFSAIFPDKMYVLDSCISNDKVKIVEVNALATSGLYDCDLNKIVDAVEEYATMLYDGERYV